MFLGRVSRSWSPTRDRAHPSRRGHRPGWRVRAITARERGYDVLRAARRSGCARDGPRRGTVRRDRVQYVRPGMSGTELARKMAKLSPDLPIVLNTGHSEEVVNMETRGARSAGKALQPRHFGPGGAPGRRGRAGRSPAASAV